MSRQIACAVKSFVIVTQNFIEAIDLSEALDAHGPSDVLHIPTFDDLLVRMDSLAFRPDGAFLAGSSHADLLDICAGRLAERGTRVVLIDSEHASTDHKRTLHLTRPYGASDLAPILSALRGGCGAGYERPDHHYS